MKNFIIVFQSTLAISIFFIANALSEAKFFPSRLSALYELIPTLIWRVLFLALPIYAVGILLLADAFNKNATITGPTTLLVNIVATIITAIVFDGLTPNLKIGLAAIICLCADILLYYALKSGK